MSVEGAVKMNRLALPDSNIFAIRDTNVKWPTLRKAYLNDVNVPKLRQHVITVGRSIIFLDGMYRTNLNQWCGKPPEERAVFFEWLHKHPKVKGGIFLLAWIGNYHNGSIFHCAWQYPQVRCWLEAGKGAEEMFERAAYRVYAQVAEILYGKDPMDHEVEEFLTDWRSK